LERIAGLSSKKKSYKSISTQNHAFAYTIKK
jgi:hypothetical protein